MEKISAHVPTLCEIWNLHIFTHTHSHIYIQSTSHKSTPNGPEEKCRLRRMSTYVKTHLPLSMHVLCDTFANLKSFNVQTWYSSKAPAQSHVYYFISSICLYIPIHLCMHILSIYLYILEMNISGFIYVHTYILAFKRTRASSYRAYPLCDFNSHTSVVTFTCVSM